jgi:hypothetical protein
MRNMWYSAYNFETLKLDAHQTAKSGNTYVEYYESQHKGISMSGMHQVLLVWSHPKNFAGENNPPPPSFM